MGIPDLVGLRLQDALEILERSGLCADIRIVRYIPPAPKDMEEECCLEERVIRQRHMEDGYVELLVSTFKYSPPGFAP